MKKSIALFTLFISLVLILTASCIPVEDAEKLWKKGKVDNKLVGLWKISDESNYPKLIQLEKTKKNLLISLYDEQTEKFTDIKIKARVIKIGDYNALLIDFKDYLKQFNQKRQNDAKDKQQEFNPIHGTDYAIVPYKHKDGKIILKNYNLKDTLKAMGVKGTENKDFSLEDGLKKLNKETIKKLNNYLDSIKETSTAEKFEETKKE